MPDPFALSLDPLSHVADNFCTELAEFHVGLQDRKLLVAVLQVLFPSLENRLSDVRL
jgi:hypothetical protein